MRRAFALLAVSLAAVASQACDGGSPVEQKPDPQLTLSVDSVTIDTGASATVTAQVLESSQPALFASRDDRVATVNAGGTISGVAVGTTYVVATLAGNANVRDSVRVRVQAPPVTVTPPSVKLTSIDTLRPGQVVQVRGSGLTELKALLLDGVAATELVVTSDSAAQFRVPAMRACETDMRVVKVSTDGATPPISAMMRVPASMTLSPAESRVLTVDDLKCLRLPAADQDYVLSAANLSEPAGEMEVMRTLLHVRVLGTGDAPAAPGPASFALPGAGTPVEPRMPEMRGLMGSYADAPVPFDPRYATAVVGDTVRFVDWFTAAPTGPDFPPQPICFEDAKSVPSFPAKVVALSGKVAVVIDLRHPDASSFLDPTKLGWLQEAAAMTDRLLLPTMRSIFDAAYQPPAGGGGRFYVLLTSLNFQGGFAYDGSLPAVTVSSQETCPRASEMVVSSVTAQMLLAPQYQNAAVLASLFLHEYAHNADLVTSRRGRTQSILNEGLASLAEETASRIGSGQMLNARHAGVGSGAPLITGAALGMWGTQPQLGPWQFNGRYAANARMLLFLRELAGEASVDHQRQPTLYQRLISGQINWLDRKAVIAHISAVLGIAYEDLTDRQTLASVTAGLIGPGVVHDLPRYTSWDHSERALQFGPLSAQFPGRASRRTTGERLLAAPDGGHAAMYLMADGARGVSLELVTMAQNARIVRLTRLR